MPPRLITKRCKPWQPRQSSSTMKKASIFFALVVWVFIPSLGQRSGQTKITTDHIRIERSGPIDKPIRELIITTKPANVRLNLMEIEILVDKDLFSFISSFIDTDDLTGKSREVNEFGVFKVTRLAQGVEQTFYFPARRKSILILKALREKMSGRPTSDILIAEIDSILKRIDY